MLHTQAMLQVIFPRTQRGSPAKHARPPGRGASASAELMTLRSLNSVLRGLPLSCTLAPSAAVPPLVFT